MATEQEQPTFTRAPGTSYSECNCARRFFTPEMEFRHSHVVAGQRFTDHDKALAANLADMIERIRREIQRD